MLPKKKAKESDPAPKSTAVNGKAGVPTSKTSTEDPPTTTASNMPPKKKAKKSGPAPKSTAASGKAGVSTSKPSSEDLSNAQKGIVRLPLELITKILANYKSIGNFTSIPDQSEKNDAKRSTYGGAGTEPKPEPDRLAGGPVLPRTYLERPDVLRALSQTCVAYRKVFLPLLYERLEVCVTTRPGNPMKAFYKHIGEALERKCEGLAKREDLWQFVGKVHVSLTRYQTGSLSTFLECLQSLPNLHTIKVLHAHTQMTTAIKSAFEKASFIDKNPSELECPITMCIGFHPNYTQGSEA